MIPTLDDIRHDMPGHYLRHGPWLAWLPIPVGFDVPARPKPLGGRKCDVGEARPGTAARERARGKRRAKR